MERTCTKPIQGKKGTTPCGKPADRYIGLWRNEVGRESGTFDATMCQAHLCAEIMGVAPGVRSIEIQNVES